MSHPETVAELVEKIKTYPSHQLCCVIENEVSDYQTLLTQVEGLSCYLQGHGVKKGDRVAIWVPNRIEWVVALLAVGRIGAILVPINCRFKESEAKYVLKHSESKVLITQSSFLTNQYLDIVMSWNVATNELEPFRSEELPDLKYLLWIGDHSPKQAATWDNAVATKSDLEKVTCIPNDPVLIQYTSGTTSFPKGALLTHFGLLRNAYDVGQRMHIERNDKVFCAGPFFHIGGVTMQVLLSLIYQVPFYSLAHFTPAKSLEMIKTHQCTTYSGIDSLFLLVMELENFKREDFSSVRTGWTTGTTETVKLIKEKMGIEDILLVYGLSEASPNVGMCDIDDPLEKRLTSCGRAHPSCEIAIIDPISLEFLPAGRRGEIVTKGYNVMLEYYKSEKETKKVFHDSWLRTGDLGSLDEDGYIYFHGRIKEIIRVGGENFSPEEVEGILYEHPFIEQVALLGVPDKRYGEIPVAIIKKKAAIELTHEQVLTYLKGKIASFKIPKKIIFVSEFPMTESGKIKKNKLKEELLSM
ncbi:AMP-binding protein [Halalkalibacter nanhaiisediminis]|uniref:Fatty-acyl-CoA synthase/long-chain acyl-CoA synthetase n=1 Tax=Halalkalibacter nanhaiisediminis TaxID=688079 RepID=A0A562QDD9_9BACI|nr:AMP-binding protein [Halalkalibacter nanhaiisediminis]TWI54723.1 fatty-acyl-CoA synthase/long-chain acyl-CoA synthetase [Halalkalibacter nanhaiisediminis]